MNTFQKLIVAAEDVVPGDWIGEEKAQGCVTAVKPLVNINRDEVDRREEYASYDFGGGVQIFVVSALSVEGTTTVIGRSLVALVGEPIAITRSNVNSVCFE